VFSFNLCADLWNRWQRASSFFFQVSFHTGRTCLLENLSNLLTNAKASRYGTTEHYDDRRDGQSGSGVCYEVAWSPEETYLYRACLTDRCWIEISVSLTCSASIRLCVIVCRWQSVLDSPSLEKTASRFFHELGTNIAGYINWHSKPCKVVAKTRD